MNNHETYNITTVLDNQINAPAYKLQKWQYRIAGDADPADYTYAQKSQLGLANYFYNLEASGRTLYFMSMTYKPFGDRVYSEKDVNTFYKNFYTKAFLPRLMHTKKYHTTKKRSIQPITYCFVDEHAHKAVKNQYTDGYTHPIRLHHHAILAVDKSHVKEMNYLLYKNSLTNHNFRHRQSKKDESYTYKVMTSDVQQCDEEAVIYASKTYKKYPNIMTFPSALKKAA